MLSRDDAHGNRLCDDDGDCAHLPAGMCVGSLDSRFCGGAPRPSCASDEACQKAGQGRYCVPHARCGGSSCADALPEPCTTAKGGCPTNHTCEPASVSRTFDGCVPRRCTKSSACDEGACVNGVCSSQPGVCVNGLPPSRPPPPEPAPPEPPAADAGVEPDAGRLPEPQTSQPPAMHGPACPSGQVACWRGNGTRYCARACDKRSR